MPRKAFTLIELLVVVTLIALLVAMLIPSLGAANRVAKITLCASNLRQIGVAAVSYAADNYTFLPMYTLSDKATNASLTHSNRANMLGRDSIVNLPTAGKSRKLNAYLSKDNQSLVAQCPLDSGYQTSELYTPLYTQPFWTIYGTSYLFNTAVHDDINGAAKTSLNEDWGPKSIEGTYNKTVNRLKETSRLVLASDMTTYYADLWWLCRYEHGRLTRMHDPLRYELNMAFADGHVGSHVVLDPTAAEPQRNLTNTQYTLLVK